MITIFKHRLRKYFAKNKMMSSKDLKSVYYFAYGANMNYKFFKTRVPDAEVLGMAELKDYVLKFNVPCEYSGKGFAGIDSLENSSVFGVLYKITPSALEFLDWAEWAPFNFYYRKNLEVFANGISTEAEVYIPSFPTEGLVPSLGYKNLIIEALKTAVVDSEYINQIGQIKHRENFILDNSFNLSCPGKARLLPARFYILHDVIREKICNYI